MSLPLEELEKRRKILIFYSREKKITNVVGLDELEELYSAVVLVEYREEEKVGRGVLYEKIAYRVLCPICGWTSKLKETKILLPQPKIDAKAYSLSLTEFHKSISVTLMNHIRSKHEEFFAFFKIVKPSPTEKVRLWRELGRVPPTTYICRSCGKHFSGFLLALGHYLDHRAEERKAIDMNYYARVFFSQLMDVTMSCPKCGSYMTIATNVKNKEVVWECKFCGLKIHVKLEIFF